LQKIKSHEIFVLFLQLATIPLLVTATVLEIQYGTANVRYLQIFTTTSGVNAFLVFHLMAVVAYDLFFSPSDSKPDHSEMPVMKKFPEAKDSVLSNTKEGNSNPADEDRSKRNSLDSKKVTFADTSDGISASLSDPLPLPPSLPI